MGMTTCRQLHLEQPDAKAAHDVVLDTGIKDVPTTQACGKNMAEGFHKHSARRFFPHYNNTEKWDSDLR